MQICLYPFEREKGMNAAFHVNKRGEILYFEILKSLVCKYDNGNDTIEMHTLLRTYGNTALDR